MTLTEINRIADLLTAAGRRNVPVPIAEWRTFEMSKAIERHDLGDDLVLGMAYAMAYARIEAAVQRFRLTGSKPTNFERGYLQGLQKARDLFGTEIKVATKSIGKATIKDGKLSPVRKGSPIQKAAAKKKAARVVKGLQQNRAKSRKG